MHRFNGFMPRLVSFLAIRSWRDLIWKSLLFFAFFNVLGLPIDYLSYSPEDRPPPFSDFWIITVLSIPVLALQFAVVTYLDRLQRKLAQLAMTDVLTGLPNRRSFIERTDAMRLETPEGTVFILDADHFKRINDTYGHAAGDACLQAVAQRLLSCSGPNDIVGRLGGEEFAAFLPNATEARVRQFGEQMVRQIQTKLDQTVDAPAQSIKVTLSIGATHADPDSGIDVLLSRADVALYAAKDQGRARMVIWDETSQTRAKAS